MIERDDLICLENVAEQANLSIDTIRNRFKYSNLPCVTDRMDGNRIYIYKNHLYFILNFQKTHTVAYGRRY